MYQADYERTYLTWLRHKRENPAFEEAMNQYRFHTEEWIRRWNQIVEWVTEAERWKVEAWRRVQGHRQTQSIDEECTHSESRVYRVWWMAVFKGVDMTKPDLEWIPETNECKWGSSWVNREDLRKWVMDEIAYRTPGGQIPSRLRQIRGHLEPTEERRRRIMTRYFREPEDLQDQAGRWWCLAKEQSLPAQDLAEELNRLTKESGNPKEWTNAIRRTAGRNQQRSPLLDDGLSWGTQREPGKLVQIGQLRHTTGIQIPKRLEEVLTETFTTSGDGNSCLWALKDLKELRTRCLKKN
jgi:hypothetical protein